MDGEHIYTGSGNGAARPPKPVQTTGRGPAELCRLLHALLSNGIAPSEKKGRPCQEGEPQGWPLSLRPRRNDLPGSYDYGGVTMGCGLWDDSKLEAPRRLRKRRGSPRSRAAMIVV